MKLTKRTQIIIEEGGFRDALYLPIDSELTDKEIEAMAQERVDNFNESLKIKVVEVEPTAEDLIDEKKSIDEQIEQLQTRKADIVETLQMGEREILVDNDITMKNRIVDNELNTSEQDGKIEQ